MQQRGARIRERQSSPAVESERLPNSATGPYRAIDPITNLHGCMVRISGASCGNLGTARMKVSKEQFDSLLGRLLAQQPEKTQAIKGSRDPKPHEPIIPKPQPSGSQ
jgi:hypothetical protein